MKKKILLAIIILFVAIRLYLPTLLKNYGNEQLNQDPIYHGHIDDVGIQLWKGAYTAYDFSIVEVRGQKTFPFMSADRIEVGLSWSELLHGSILANMRVKNLQVNIVQEPAPEKAKEKEKAQEKNKKDEGEPKKIVIGAKTKEGKKAELTGWRKTFKNLVPLDVSSLSIIGDSIHFRDLTSNPKLDVYLDNLEIHGSNLTNSRKVSQDLFGIINLKARAMKSGHLNVKLFIDPLVVPPEFKATVSLKDLDLTKLNELFTAYANLEVAQGKISIFSEMATAHNNLKGYVKPIIQDLKVADFEKDKKKGLGHALWEQIVGFLASILKNFPKDRQAAVIPIEGKLDDPKTDGWEIAKSILRNMFGQAIPAKLDHSIKLKDVKK